MKIRTGFLSNSSSSSFCLLGVNFGRKGISAVTKKDLKTFQEICVFTNLDGNEGQILLHISDEDFLEFVQLHEQDLELGVVYGVVTTTDVDPKSLTKIKGKLALESTIEDYGSPRCLSDMKELLQWAKPELLNDEVKEEE
jgi:hypothetical protein